MPAIEPAKVVRASEGEVLDRLGDRQVIKIAGENTGGAFALIEQSYGPGRGSACHIHDAQDHVLQVISGRIDLRLDDREQRLEHGDLVLVPRGTAHGFVNPGPEAATIHLSVFPAGLEDVLRRINALPPEKRSAETVAELSASLGTRLVPGRDVMRG